MNDDLYQEELLDHYHHPHNFGGLPQPTCRIVERNASCGDEITLDIMLDDTQHVSDISFQGNGCCISMASASKLTDYAKGKTIEELKKIDFEFMQNLVGTIISPGRIKCLTLSAKALMKALEHSLAASGLLVK